MSHHHSPPLFLLKFNHGPFLSSSWIISYLGKLLFRTFFSCSLSAQAQMCSVYRCSDCWTVRGLHGLGAFWHKCPLNSFMPLFHEYVPVCCSAEVTEMVVALRWIMTKVLNKYQRPSLSERYGERFLIHQWVQGQGTTSWGGLGGNIWETPPAKSYFLLGGKTPFGLCPLRLTDASRDNHIVVSK